MCKIGRVIALQAGFSVLVLSLWNRSLELYFFPRTGHPRTGWRASPGGSGGPARAPGPGPTLGPGTGASRAHGYRGRLLPGEVPVLAGEAGGTFKGGLPVSGPTSPGEAPRLLILYRAERHSTSQHYGSTVAVYKTLQYKALNSSEGSDSRLSTELCAELPRRALLLGLLPVALVITCTSYVTYMHTMVCKRMHKLHT